MNCLYFDEKTKSCVINDKPCCLTETDRGEQAKKCAERGIKKLVKQLSPAQSTTLITKLELIFTAIT